MNNILVLGAGRSSSALISYLLSHAPQNNWQVTVGDVSENMANERIRDSVYGKAIRFDIEDEAASAAMITEADVVISVLPAHFHPIVAKHCLTLHKHLFNASYVSDEMKAFHNDAREKGLLFLNECGLDPGIDHMSAMLVIDRIREQGGKLISFESFTGGLIAPDTDPSNPWRYKFTWNPRNVVMAGQGTAKFLRHGEFKYIPYQQLFKRTTSVSVPGFGDFEGYANRDSLRYIDTYRLHDIETMLRGTLRQKGFCAAWNIFVQLGCCEDTWLIEGVEQMTHRDFINAFLEYDPTKTIEEKLVSQFQLIPQGPELKKLKWSGFFDDEKIGLDKGTPAQILEHILNKKWRLRPEDKDMIVMWHRFIYTMNGDRREVQASLVAKGEDAAYTAMAKTVGLPLAITAKLFLQGKIQTRGVAIPIEKEFYLPVLHELKLSGIELVETEM